MIRKTIVLGMAALFVSSAAFAGAPGKNKKPAKTNDVMVCPISGKDSTSGTGGTEKVGKYTVHFCCPDCKAPFDKLTAKQKNAKIKEALKKGPPAKTSDADTDSAKLVSLEYCPMTGEKVVGAGGGSSTYKNYKVNFCCAGCKAPFDKLSDADKQAKIDAALKKG